MLKFDANGLIPAIAQDARTGEILMVAYMNQESFERTLEIGQAVFWSRSRQEMWHKGGTSGNFLGVQRIFTDCDNDTILMLVEPMGPACHTGRTSCFFKELSASADGPSLREMPDAEPLPLAGSRLPEPVGLVRTPPPAGIQDAGRSLDSRLRRE